MSHRRTLALTVLAAAAVVHSALPAVAEAEQAPRPAFAGAAALFSVAEITVVYPAGGEAERSELARRSAEHRAAYLRYRGVDATVAADDEVTPEMRSGHLLLLGWDNALLPGGVVAPAAGGRTVFGIPVGLAEDILFVAASPWASGSGVVFWSRIDPELDRLVPIPFLGSQWGVYRGHRLLGQGMFAPGTAWPPRRSPWTG